METLTRNNMLHKIISRGTVSGEYQAFPDSCRLQNGDIVAVFYAGYTHISYPNADYPTGGKLCMVRSCDEGRTWSEPQVIYDDELDNRDPHIAQLSDGSVICVFFSIWRSEKSEDGYECSNVFSIRSLDGGETWGPKTEIISEGELRWAASAPVREMPNGICILPLYHQAGKRAYAGVTHSHDKGQTWGQPVSIGEESGLFLPAETDLILLSDGTLYAVLRGDDGQHMQYATSADSGLSWSTVKDIGFEAHAPHFTRLSSGEILLSCRGINDERTVVNTVLYVSRDECRSWLGPYVVDEVGGAYSSTIELTDGSILTIYYEEGAGSAIRARKFVLPPDLQILPFD